MTINDTESPFEEIMFDLVRSMIPEIFPEFEQHEASADCPLEACRYVRDKTDDLLTQNRILSESDFVHVLSKGFNLFDEPLPLNDSDKQECSPCLGARDTSDFAAPDTSTLIGRQEIEEQLDSYAIPDFGGLSDRISSPVLISEFNPMPFDVYTIRKDFPILDEKINGKNLIWFDNAATTQKPRQVIDRLKYFYEHENSNIHRAAHTLAARTTDAYEGARKKVAAFLNADGSHEIVFVRGATEGINLVAQTYGLQNLQKDDEVIITMLEHHANIVPWQMVCKQTGARLKAAPVDDEGQIILYEFEKLLSARTKLVAFTHVSNALGTITPVFEMIDMAHRHGAKVLVDGAQAAAHLKVDVKALDCDFYVFSGHKVFGPTGIGVLFGKADLLEAMGPYQGGGNMISDVTIEKSSYKSPPHRFEAGTGSIADAIGLGAALDYISKVGLDAIFQYEHELLEYARSSLQQIPGLMLLGHAPQKTGILSFLMEGHTPEEVGKALNKEGIAVRTGHHCSQPILRRYGLESTIRASFALYNTREEIDFFVSTLQNIAPS